MQLTRILTAFALVTVLGLPAAAAPPTGDASWCGTHALTGVTSLARHLAEERRLEREREAGRLPLKMAPKVTRIGQIAVIEDDGSLVPAPRRFDLDGTSIQFLRRPKGISAVRAPVGFLNNMGQRVEIGDDASLRVDFPADFRFPFGDAVYDHAFVNSDGNITFERADSSSAPRTLERFLSGPPRVAPLFTDLDPSATSGTDGVYVHFLPSRFRVTWVGVPEFGSTNSNTFQVTFFDNGRVLFAFGDQVDALRAVVGVHPFEDGGLELIDFDVELPHPPERVAIVEPFTNVQVINDVQIARTFFEHFRDAYDQISVWTDFPISLAGGGAFAYAFSLKNGVEGLGQPLFDISRNLGLSRFEHYMQMGHVRKYSTDPEELVNRTYNSLGILAHEAGHRWLSFVRLREGNQNTRRLLGAGLAHWSFHMDADGSLMEGNDLMDRGDGTFISTERTTTHFSLLDQYLMGLVPAGGVPDFFYVDNADAFNSSDVPRSTGAAFGGDRVDTSVDAVIAANGLRRPRPATSKKDFRTAFILIVRPGEAPTQESLDRLNAIRRQYPAYWNEITGGRSTMRMGLFPR